MEQLELGTLKPLRNYLLKNVRRVVARRASPEYLELRRKLDEALLAFRVARRVAAETKTLKGRGSWIRAVRQATGIPVYVLATRLGVKKHEVFRLEKAEEESRIILANLRRAGSALGCELVYALVPRQGSLKELAETELKARKAAQDTAKRADAANTDQADGWIDWQAAVRRDLRKELRKTGLRVR